MKKLLYFMSFLSLAVSALGVMPAGAAPLQDERVFTFADLGLGNDLVLHGPYDSNSIRFELPPTWELQSGLELEIVASSFITGDTISTGIDENFLGALLDVYFNDKLQQSIPLESGNGVVYRVPISLDALISPSSNGSHKITFFLDAALDCDFDLHKTTVSISVNSRAAFQYSEKELSLDLRGLPWPFHQENGVEKASTVLVVPEAPSADELQAALVTAGAFGRMTRGNLPVPLIPISQLTEELRNQSHVILVGKPSAFSILAEATLPVPLAGDGFALPGLTSDDGVLQAVPSPWSLSKVLLVVSGNTDQGVVKAAQALSTANLQTGDTPDYSIVAAVNPLLMTGILDSTLTPITTPDVLLSDLGYESTTATGIGTNWLTFQFVIPTGQTPAEGPYIDIKFSTSALVDPNRSGGVIYLNDILIGSLKLSADESNIVTTRVNLPVSVLRSGLNTLDVVLNMLPRDECSVFAFSGLWVTIYPDSVLHLPLVPAEATSFSMQDIKAYPLPFANDPSLSTTAFVLSDQDRVAWALAGRVAYDLGARVTSPVLGFELAYNDQLPDDIRARNLIVIGEPKGLKIVSDLKGAMPAYFETESNIAVLESQQVIYRISENKKLGYLELFASPWDETQTILGIFGTSAEGLVLAGDSLLNVDRRDALGGNFVTLDGVKPVVVDTRTGLGLGRFEAGLGPSVVTQQDPATPEPSGFDQSRVTAQARRTIALGIGAVTVLIATVIFAALWLRKRRN